MPMTTNRPHARAGFTLMELLVVLGIIGALIAITLGIGQGMVESGKQRQTANTLKTLDLIAHEHQQSSEAPIPWYVTPASGNTTFVIPLVDGVDRTDTFNNGAQSKGAIPALSWYLKQITEQAPVASAEALLNQIDSKLRLVEVLPTGVSPQAIAESIPGKKISVLDGWGRPIRMVHPEFDGVFPPRTGGSMPDNGGPTTPIRGMIMNPNLPGAMLPVQQIRRNYVSDADRKARKNAGLPYIMGDSDGGTCPTDKPYFYSCGKDGDPSTRSDNVYSVRPKFGDPD